MLITIFLCSNILFLVLLFLVTINAEVCNSSGPYNLSCNDNLQYTAQISGLLLVCFAEPLVLISYMFRFLRIKRVFDAQLIYFQTEQNPKDMINRYSESRLALNAAIIITVFAALYMTVGCSTWITSDYGDLPTYALSWYFSQNEHQAVSSIFFIFSTLIMGFIFAYFLNELREIKREFSMLAELQYFALIWLVTTDLALFVLLQFESHYVEITLYRILFWFMWVRQMSVALLATI